MKDFYIDVIAETEDLIERTLTEKELYDLNKYIDDVYNVDTSHFEIAEEFHHMLVKKEAWLTPLEPKIKKGGHCILFSTPLRAKDKKWEK